VALFASQYGHDHLQPSRVRTTILAEAGCHACEGGHIREG
jgi:hypothetical protein